MINPREITSRLGIDAVLLPIKRGTKYPCQNKWQQTTFPQTRTPAYQAKLARASAIGVLLGHSSQGLCSIDFDCEEALREFLEANPLLRKSLMTRGKRGANIWVIIDGEIPPSHKLSSRSKPIGEWRAEGNHTIIAGAHPDGCQYSRLVDSAPQRLSYAEIIWPWVNSKASPSPPYSSSESSENSVKSKDSRFSMHSKALYPEKNLGGKIRASVEARNKLDKNPRLKKLYNRFIEKRFSPAQGRRNKDLVSMVTFLYHSVGNETLMALVLAFYDLNQEIFTDSRAQHLAEATSHLEACERTWQLELSTSEHEFIEGLPTNHVEAFRICRDLAKLGSEGITPGRFFMSYRELADRLGIPQKEAERILRAFECHGRLGIAEKGTQHKLGCKGKATYYQWILLILVPFLLILSFDPLMYLRLFPCLTVLS